MELKGRGSPPGSFVCNWVGSGNCRVGSWRRNGGSGFDLGGLGGSFVGFPAGAGGRCLNQCVENIGFLLRLEARLAESAGSF